MVKTTYTTLVQINARVRLDEFLPNAGGPMLGRYGRYGARAA